MGDRGGLIKVSLHQVELDENTLTHSGQIGPGPFLKLTVSDTGPGMEEEVKNRVIRTVFHHQAPRGRGPGWGLAVVYRIVDASRVELPCTARRACTTFHLFFPSIEKKLETVSPPQADIPGDRKPFCWSTMRRIYWRRPGVF